ncbi:3-deoxy-D-manno-octulosonic acid transferase [Tabrizicola sp. TH137]|uniref:3-deoxy-D-manno-octulosonic acid transferase n=1 Tax=Tabrizicola sp. TH137 TaxID=2067452 RepID=UPI000C7BBBEA|nr:glycosyltransferase N-terminal domain-containing protein [Tabrizicola sp. TH137]PLL12473.1 3-deoxy-D-manno-octulosonic acid transferase [Tabrizicola sp. TH137]
MSDPSPLPSSSGPPSSLPDAPALALWRGVTWALAPFAPLLLRWRRGRGKEDEARWREKLGVAGAARPAGEVIWLHAVSVGEGLSVLPLVKALRAGRAGATVLLTCGTVTAARLLAERVPEGVILQFLPLDLPGPVRRFLDHWRPDVAVLVESEFWPRLMRAVVARGVPLVLANARISDRSAARWSRARGVARALLGHFTVIGAPDAAMAARLVSLGADPGRVRVLGTLKRAAEPLAVDEGERARLAAVFGEAPLWLAASTHAGEEEAVAAAQLALRAAVPGARLILAPRHPARAEAVAEVMRAAGLTVARRSLGEGPEGAEVYLADTLGEMGLWFALAPVSFLGGSLVADVGGHNAYEPAVMGSAILHGPGVGNFADLYARLGAAGGAAEVADGAALAQAVAGLWEDPARRGAMVHAARGVLEAEADGVAATAGMILSCLALRGAPQ